MFRLRFEGDRCIHPACCVLVSHLPHHQPVLICLLLAKSNRHKQKRVTWAKATGKNILYWLFLFLSLFSPCLILYSSIIVVNCKHPIDPLEKEWACQESGFLAASGQDDGFNTSESLYLSSHVTGNRKLHKHFHAHLIDPTHIFIRGLVEGNQVRMEASQSHYRPQCEEAHKHLHHSRRDS